MTRKAQKKLTKLSETAKKLSLKQRRFCELYVTSSECFSNGTKSYMKAYGCTYGSAKVNSSRLLTNINILTYMNELLEESGLNNVVVDNELRWLIMRRDERGLGAKMAAIREYNRLRGRVKDLVTSGGAQHNWFINMVDKAEERASDVVDVDYGESSRDVDLKNIVRELRLERADS
jgi:phage terminase small subunit